MCNILENVKAPVPTAEDQPIPRACNEFYVLIADDTPLSTHKGAFEQPFDCRSLGLVHTSFILMPCRTSKQHILFFVTRELSPQHSQRSHLSSASVRVQSKFSSRALKARGCRKHPVS